MVLKKATSHSYIFTKALLRAPYLQVEIIVLFIE